VERSDRGDRGVDRVAVVGAAATVEPPVLETRRPRPEARLPTFELGLLIEVAVEAYRLRAGVVAAHARRRHVEEDDRRSPFEADHLELEARDALALDPRGGVADDAIDEAVLLPFGIEHRALRRHRDVVGDARDDLLVPGARGEAAERFCFVLANRLQRVACVHVVLLEGEAASVSSHVVSTAKTSSRSGSLKIS